MARIHVPGDGHVAPLPKAGWQWKPYSDVKKRRVVERALFILRTNVKGMKPCNECFKKLPGMRSFDDILNDPELFISFDPGNIEGRYGVTIHAGGKEVSITDWAIRMGRWLVASTLIHEFAHVNGAPGTSSDAEDTLICCGFSAHHVPGIIGATGSASTGNYA